MSGVPAVSPDPAAARDAARSILSQQRFHPARVPHPLTGVLRWIGDRFAPIGRVVDKVFSPLADYSQTTVGLLIVGGVLIAIVALIAWRIARRRLTLGRSGRPEGYELEHTSRDPRELERAADRAEEDGKLALAIRLRFRAGLLRLDERGAIAYQPSITTRVVARRLGSVSFDNLAHEFDLVAYGFHEPSLDEVVTTKREWQQVLELVDRR
jgi:hypothetical protein